jgi:hypothetical protein
MNKAIQIIADTLSKKPEVGVFGSMVGVALSPAAIISLISAILGLIVAVITVIIKVMDLIHKLRLRRGEVHAQPDDEYIVVEGRRYRREEVESEEE